MVGDQQLGAREDRCTSPIPGTGLTAAALSSFICLISSLVRMAHGDTKQARFERIVSLADARHCWFHRNVRRIRVQVRRLAAGPNLTCGRSDGTDAQPNTGYSRSRRRTLRPTRDRPRKKHSKLADRRQSEPKCARPLAPALHMQSLSRQLTSIPMHCRVRMNRPRQSSL
jgi:hypothetical protein